ncbi:hypothetical protein [Glycomyces sp. YM15]|uniref:hypothetical protein n=1 Tax=Glycomyces sp. YM15 TaxID=2800446 RepID=UPI001964904E|nr:hypothetical protein [Glycomyces sp. YM15]
MIEFGNGEIGCDHDAFRKRFNTSDWKSITPATGDEGLRADMYSDPDAGPGHVRAIVAEATKIGDVWQMRLCATVVDNDGQAHTGTLGKHYKELTSAASAKMQATRNAHGFARGNRVEFEPDVHSGPWQPGDWVIDAAGAVWVRASETDAAAGMAWAKPPAAARRQRASTTVVAVPAGRVDDARVTLPVHLLIRNGYPVQA